MGINLEGQTCPVCHAYLFNEDDVVFCPTCGAPHHRECYNKSGHCALEEFHGTDREYDRNKFVKESAKKEKQSENKISETECVVCHKSYDKEEQNCPHCGAPNVSGFNANFIAFDFLGGVPADYDIGEGVTADEAKRFVGTNTPRYVQKFSVLNKRNKASWNWLAFLLPGCWYLTRKMYLRGIIFTCLQLLLTLFALPASTNMPEIMGTGYLDVLESYSNAITSIDIKWVILLTVGAVGMLALRLVCAITADYSYKKFTIKNVLDIKANSEDIDADFRKRGGINVIAMTIGLAILLNADFIISYIYSLF